MTTAIVAVVMCGGKGTRMTTTMMEEEPGAEKPMTELAGRSFVERVVLALKESGRFERIMAAVSPSTPATRKFLLRSSLGIEVTDTPGAGYPQDLAAVLKGLAPARVLVVPADVPLLTAAIVSEIVDRLAEVCAPAASIAIEKSFVQSLGVTPSVVIAGSAGSDLFCHSGITLFDAACAKGESMRTGMLEERYVVMNRMEIALNVNTKREKEVAESLLVKRANDLAGDERL